jgi:hypothetical protein
VSGEGDFEKGDVVVIRVGWREGGREGGRKGRKKAVRMVTPCK